MPLPWSFVEEVRQPDPRFMDLKADAKIWEKIKSLQIGDPLPQELPDYFYTHVHSYLQTGKFSERIEPFLRHFPRQK